MGKSSKNKRRMAGYSDTPDLPASKMVPIRLDSAQAAARVDEAERIPIFELDGTTYSIPAAERADVAIEYLARSERDGDDVAAWYLLNETLGAEAVKALRGVKGLEASEFDGIMTRVRKVVMPKSRRPKAPGR